MQGNEIELIFRKKSNDQAVKYVLMQLAEEQESMKKVIADMAQTFDKLASVMGMLNTVVDGVTEKIDKMKMPDDGMGPTRGLVS